jgi:cytochrome b
MQVVWNPWLRVLHGLLAAAMITSFATHEHAGALHEASGYVALAVALLRVFLGIFATGYWRFGQFVRGPSATLAYARDVWAHREARYLGHNPLGGWMVLVMLADAIGAGLTGWLTTTDRFFGLGWLAQGHEILGHALLPLLVLHLAGVALASVRHRENLVAAMVHGKKPD